MAAAAADGQEKVVAAAQHIVKLLANSKNAVDNMICMLLGFDNCLSLMSDLFPPLPPLSAAAVDSVPEEWDTVVEVVEQWDSPRAGDRMLFDSLEDADEYLTMATCLMGAPGPHAAAMLQAAMARLKEEIHHLLIRGAPPLAAKDLQASLLRRLSLTVPSFNSSVVDLGCPSFASQRCYPA
ncbi:hypothetical protein ACP4OV_017308 [Aristida adscensionis]